MDEIDHQSAVRLAVLETRLNGTLESISLQAKEYERRLGELNHSHQQQVDRNATYVSRELWDSKLTEWETWRRQIEQRNSAYLASATWESAQKEWDTWRRQIDQWRWISIGAAAASGAVAGYLTKLLAG